MHLGKYIQMVRALRGGAPLGDVVMLKVDALASLRKGVVRRFDAVKGYAPPQDLVVLRALPPRTLGREYARFLDANGIEPLNVSEAMRARFRDEPYALRYTMTHDLHHVLTGFDAGLAGELGVLAFNVGQGAAPVSAAMLWFGRLFVMMLSPTQALRIWHNTRVGLELGRRAKLVMAEPVESWFDEPLEGVRRRLSVADPIEAGVLPSGNSIFGRLIYPAGKPRTV